MLKIIKFIKRIFYKVGSCFYVGATDVLPEPLSREEEDKLVKLKEEGDTVVDSGGNVYIVGSGGSLIKVEKGDEYKPSYSEAIPILYML